jgi:lantibiotic biosynthesis protein
MTWEPLLDGAQRDRALEIVATMAAASDITVRQPGLMGTMGIAIFLAHASSAGLCDDLRALNAVDRGLADLEDGRTYIGLWNGAAGVRWVVTELTGGEGSDALLAQLDRAIRARLAGPSIDGYDLYSGLAGVLLAYADDATHGDRVLAHVLDRLEGLPLLPSQRHEIGCSHGVAGVLGALACSHLRGRSDERAAPLMLAIASALENSDVTDQRVGWCRGELGIAIALLAAARALARDDLVNRAIAMALAPHARRTARWPVEQGLCHGAAGIGHLYNRMYQATRDDRFAVHARTWLLKAMIVHREQSALSSSTPDPSLLSGFAGIGLALLAGVTSTAPTWDRLLGADLG